LRFKSEDLITEAKMTIFSVEFVPL
jgi:hypothetical protein